MAPLTRMPARKLADLSVIRACQANALYAAAPSLINKMSGGSTGRRQVINCSFVTRPYR